MVMVSEKLGLVLGFDGDGNACFSVCVLVNGTLCLCENSATSLAPPPPQIVISLLVFKIEISFCHKLCTGVRILGCANLLVSYCYVRCIMHIIVMFIL